MLYMPFWFKPYLVGGLEHFLFSPIVGMMIQSDQYFSEGLKPPTSYYHVIKTHEKPLKSHEKP